MALDWVSFRKQKALCSQSLLGPSWGGSGPPWCIPPGCPSPLEPGRPQGKACFCRDSRLCDLSEGSMTSYGDGR